MQITIEGWDPVDRQPVRGCFQGLDRAQTQAAEHVTVQLQRQQPGGSGGGAAVTIKQNPGALRGASGVRVGAAVWDGAYVLAAYLDAQPAGSFAGVRCVELGCGLGLVGLVLARLGAAAVYLTDKPNVLVAPRVNAAKNKLLRAAPAAAAAAAAGARSQPEACAGLQPLQPPPAAATSSSAAAGTAAASNGVLCRQQSPQQPAASNGALCGQQSQQQHHHHADPPPQQQHIQQPQQGQQQAPAGCAPVVQVVALDWEQPGALAAAAAAIRAEGPIDLIVASDCIYPDPDGSVPSSSGFIAAVCALATRAHTRVLTTFEARSDELRQALMAAAAGAPGGCQVVRLGLEDLPEGFRAQHVELYELRLM